MTGAGAGTGSAVRAERTKLWTLAGVRWLLVAVVAAMVVVGAAVASTVEAGGCGGGGGCAADPVRASLAGVWVAQIAAAVLGVVAMSSEYETPQIRLTLAAMPRRLEVLVAKVGVLAGAVAVAGAAGTAGALAAGRLVLAGNGLAGGAAVADGPTLRAAVGTVCYLTLVAVLSLGVATLLRDAAVSVVAVLALLYLFPILALVVTDPTWQHRLHRYAPMEAGLAVQATRATDDLAIGPWAGLAVVAVYAVAAVTAGGALFHGRDA
jgi:ABC-2 type transport system permease protein